MAEWEAVLESQWSGFATLHNHSEPQSLLLNESANKYPPLRIAVWLNGWGGRLFWFEQWGSHIPGNPLSLGHQDGWSPYNQAWHVESTHIFAAKMPSTNLCRVRVVIHRVLWAPLIHCSPMEVELLQLVVVFQGATTNSWKVKPLC